MRGEQVTRVFDGIKEDDLVRLAVEMGNIRSPAGSEKEMGDYVYGWMDARGFKPRRIGCLPDRFNVLGRYPGTGGGLSLMFNAHMDQAAYPERDFWNIVNLDAPQLSKAWREGDRLFGYGVVNDKGPMACFMVAAKALKEAGVALKGDLVLTTVCGETEQGPVDEFAGPAYENHSLGARYLITHGGVADYALVAEATAFSIVPVQCGILWLKITLYAGPYTYIPFIPRPQPMEKSINAVVRAAKVIERLEQWAYEYEQRYRYDFKGGVQVPKASVGAIRGGSPFRPSGTPEYCSLYVDLRTPPTFEPLDVVAELKEIITGGLGIPADIEIFSFLRGYEAKNADRLEAAIKRAHREVLGGEPGPPASPMVGMWRDINPFNEVGIPALCYAFPTGYTTGAAAAIGEPSNYYVEVQDLVRLARIYALLAMDFCNQDRPGPPRRH